MVKPKSAPEIADVLKEIYKKQFMRKKSGNYKITKNLLKEIIGGRKNIKLSNIMEKVRVGLLEDNYILVDLEDSFLVCNKKQINRQRKVPRSVVLEYIYIANDNDCGIVTEADAEYFRKNLHKYI